jgi:hypothetical protein
MMTKSFRRAWFPAWRGKAETTFLSAARPPGRRVTKDQDTLARLAASLPAGRASFPVFNVRKQEHEHGLLF